MAVTLPSMSSSILVALCLCVAAAAADPMVVGYFGANDNTPALSAIPDGYNVLIFAFANINPPYASPSPVSGGFRLDKPPADLRQQIAGIHKARPDLKVLFSIGGEDAAITGTTMPMNASVLSNTLTYWGFDGVDLDLETVTDPSKLQEIIDMVNNVKKSKPSVIISMAPQTGFSPGENGTIGSLAPAFIYTPLLKGVGDNVDIISVQFYNNWPCSSALADCVSKTNMAEWMQGLARSLGMPDTSKLVAGFPASPQAATSGYQSPATMEAFAKDVVKPGIVGGVMTWSVEWDHTTGYSWVKAIMAGLGE